MPLLDPLQQFYFCYHSKSNHSKEQESQISNFSFFLEYFPTAIQNLHCKSITFESHVIFEKYFLKNISFLNKKYKLSISQEEINELQITDYFYYFYMKLNQINQTGLSKFNGTYYQIDSETSLNIFEPFTTYSKIRRWYFTDSSFAILSVNYSLTTNDQDFKDILSLIQLEASFLKSLGLTLVLCYYIDYGSKINQSIFDFLLFIQECLFSEIHMNIDHTQKNINSSHLQFLRNISENINKLFPINEKNKFFGYFYLYISYSDQLNKEFKVETQYPYFNQYYYSSNLETAIKTVRKTLTEPFIYCNSGFQINMIRVNICEIPLYDEMYDNDSLSPSRISKIESCYVSADDFMRWKGSRVEILFDDDSIYYANFNDLHLTKPELYVDDTLLLIKRDKEIHNVIDQIISKSNKFQPNEDDLKELDFKKKENIINLIAKLSFSIKTLYKIDLRRNQLFLIYEACKSCLFSEVMSEKGFVYQFETGEGKSVIIRLIAAILALKGKSVQIVTSNIHLAKRDYVESHKFYNIFKITSSVLLHKNEKKEPANMKDKDFLINYREAFNDSNFNDDQFENSLKMNFPVCGFGNNKKIIDNCPKIVYSTVTNFEALYLTMTEYLPMKEINEIFGQKILLIDEADTILIDDLANGTILSRPIQSNAEQLLTFVYQCKMGKLSPKNIDKIIDYFGLKRDNSKFDYFSKYDDLNLEIKKSKDDRVNNAKKVLDMAFSTRLVTISDLVFLLDKIWYKQKDDEMIGEVNNLYKDKERIYYKADSHTIDFVSFICQTKIHKPNPTTIKQIIQKVWPESKDINEDQIRYMFREIKMVHDDEFTNGKIYSIENKKKKNKGRDSFMKTIVNVASKIINVNNEIERKAIDKIIEKSGKDIKEEETEEEEIEKEFDVVPFDYSNKGILEKNKEFSGFIQQFIAIKEMTNNPEMKGKIKVKNLSLNSLFVSHPLFVKLYKSVCGFTGTIGNEKDEKLLKEQYNLSAFRIPRYNPNHLVELPTIICKDIDERDQKILDEVLSFYLLNIPVLVILRDLIEINKIKDDILKIGVDIVNVFDGKNNQISPESIAGKNGSISLGTNFCGRGSNIEAKGNPLHVIVSYYSSNVRVMQQAFGRTARNGNEGSCRVICLRDQFIQSNEVLNNKSIKDVLTEIDLKKAKQSKFIHHYQKKLKCIYQDKIDKQEIEKDFASKLKESRINVNRIVAYTYKYPICMSIETFLSIQAQKIFSIYNCPNSKYTWMLFQRYVREMILESWSLMIEKVDRDYFILKKKDKTLTYKDYLKKEVKNLKEQLNQYLPTHKDIKFIDIFKSVFEKVNETWNVQFKNLYNNALSINDLPFKTTLFPNSFVSINFGVMFFSLLDESGAVINSMDNDNTNAFIKDPEISYFRLKEGRKFFVSITEKIDDIFNRICSTISELIESYIGLKFFMRRTIAGCEFGICYDLFLSNKNFDGMNCLIDKNPLFVFTIHTKSSTAILAGILIVVLVYIGKIVNIVLEVIQNIATYGIKIVAKNALLYAVKCLCENKAGDKINDLLSNVINVLKEALNAQINNITAFHANLANKFTEILKVIDENRFSNLIDLLLGKLGASFVMNESLKDVFEEFFPSLLKIGLLVFMLLVAFFSNFNHKLALNGNDKKYNYQDRSVDFDDSNDKDKSIKDSKSLIDSLDKSKS